MLYEYQKQALDKAKPSFMYALDTGTGKTILSIYHYLKHGKGEPLTIIAPPAKVKEKGWQRDIKKVCDHEGIDIDFEVVSYGVIVRRKDDFQGNFVIFDECHYAKNPTSKRGKASAHIAKNATNFVLLSATPASNGWADCINYFIMFGFTKNKTQFNYQYGIIEQRNFGGRFVNVVTSYRHERELQNEFQRWSMKLKKEDCLDLPPLVYERIFFKPSKLYKQIEKHRVYEKDGQEIICDTIASLMSSLRVHASLKDKAKYLSMLIEGTEENIVIFYNFNAERDAILEAIEGKEIFEVSGKRTKLPERSEWDTLKNSVTIVQYQAGSSGIELQYANNVVIFSPTYSLQDHEQAMGRCYRNGQDKKVTVYQFMTEKSIEGDVYHALDNKRDFVENLYFMGKYGEKGA